MSEQNTEQSTHEILARQTEEGIIVKLNAPMAEATVLVGMLVKAISEVSGLKPHKLLGALSESFDNRNKEGANERNRT